MEQKYEFLLLICIGLCAVIALMSFAIYRRNEVIKDLKGCLHYLSDAYCGAIETVREDIEDSIERRTDLSLDDFPDRLIDKKEEWAHHIAEIRNIVPRHFPLSDKNYCRWEDSICSRHSKKAFNPRSYISIRANKIFGGK